MYQKEFWQNKNKEYLNKYGIDRPNIFAKIAISYFPPEAKILDLAAGIGHDSLYFAKKGFNVTSTDYSKESLESASRQAKIEGLNINFQSLDLSNSIPFKDGSFDVVYCHMGLHYFNDKETKRIFREINRVMKKNGVFAALFNTVEDPEIEILKINKIEKNLYLSPQGVSKRFFSVNYLQDIISGLFSPIILDDKGATYKDGKDANLIRFIGKKS